MSSGGVIGSPVVRLATQTRTMPRFTTIPVSATGHVGRRSTHPAAKATWKSPVTMKKVP